MRSPFAGIRLSDILSAVNNAFKKNDVQMKFAYFLADCGATKVYVFCSELSSRRAALHVRRVCDVVKCKNKQRGSCLGRFEEQPRRRQEGHRFNQRRQNKHTHTHTLNSEILWKSITKAVFWASGARWSALSHPDCAGWRVCWGANFCRLLSSWIYSRISPCWITYSLVSLVFVSCHRRRKLLELEKVNTDTNSV